MGVSYLIVLELPTVKKFKAYRASNGLVLFQREFEEDALSWEDRLNKINALFDVWIDVQRRWVYLEGLFSGSADIATLLPMESNRFFGVSNEFLALMKRVNSSPRILEVVHIQVNTFELKLSVAHVCILGSSAFARKVG